MILTWNSCCQEGGFPLAASGGTTKLQQQKDKMVCGKPGAKWVQFGMKILDNRNKKDSKPHHSGRRFFQGG